MALALAPALVLSMGRPGWAATFLVDSLSDSVDASPGDGLCADALGACTLRAAVMEANAWPGRDRVVLPAGTIDLTRPGTDEDDSATGDLDFRGDLELVGAGRESTVVSIAEDT